jgi:hypothetical protein
MRNGLKEGDWKFFENEQEVDLKTFAHGHTINKEALVKPLEETEIVNTACTCSIF